MSGKQHVVIVGGGLSGLTLAYLLQGSNYDVSVVEASTRLGGRIQTVKGDLGTPLELGATWFADKHEKLSALLTELGLEKYPQYSKGITLFQTKSFEPPQQFYVPEADYPSYRIVGGTQAVIDALVLKLKGTVIRLNAKVNAVQSHERGLTVILSNGEFVQCDKAVICIPPQLASSSIEFSSEFPQDVSNLLLTVQTWMAGAVKFVVEYSEPFWRENGFSGMLFSHADIVTEMYDHTNFEANKFGFTGFLNGGSAAFSREVRKTNVLRQLSELFGPDALNPVSYFDKVWNDEYLIVGNQIIGVPHQNNGHPFLQEGYLDGKLFFCGTETAIEFGGYMEGAVQSAIRVANDFI
jgi:monoamine oxidase